MTDKPRAVIYAAKSSEDKHGSIPTQLADCRALAERHGWEIVGEFSDEAFSAYSGNRGPGLERAKALAVRTAAERGRCILAAQDADRFARGAGDAPGAADHLGEVYFAMKRQRVELWTERSGHLDLLRAAIEGERSHDESARKTQAIKAGLKRRRDDRGQPVGAVPIGYTVKATIGSDGRPVSERVPDAQGVAVLNRMWELNEAGHTPGQISKTLNAEGARTKRGGHWTTRAVSSVLQNPDYCGGTGYPQLIERDRWEAIQARLTRRDPASVQRGKGGRPASEAFLLAGLAFCHSCGAPMRCQRYRTGTRIYKCRHGLEGFGLCAARPVRAEVAEQRVLEHLDQFIGAVEDWLRKKAVEHTEEQSKREAALDRERAALSELDRARARHFGQYRALVDSGSHVAHLALEEVDRIDRELEAQRQKIAEAEAVISEWSGHPDADAALDYYTAVRDVIEGRLRKAKGIKELNAALSSVIAGIWMEVDGLDELHAEVELRPTLANEAGRRVELPGPDPILAELVETSLVGSAWWERRYAKPDTSPSCTSSLGARRSRDTSSPRP